MANSRRNNASLVLVLDTNGGATTVVRRQVAQTPEAGIGDGQQTWKAPVEKYYAVSNATRQEPHDELGKTKLSVRIAVFVASATASLDWSTLNLVCEICTWIASHALQAPHQLQGAGSPCKRGAISVV